MPLSSTTCLVFLLFFFFVFNHQNTCKLVTCEVHLRDFKMLENKMYLIGTCFGVLLLQNKFARLLKTSSWLSSNVSLALQQCLDSHLALQTSGPTCCLCILTFIRKQASMCGAQDPVIKTLPDIALSCSFSIPASLPGSSSLFLFPLYFLI